MERHERDFKGVWIPRDIWLSEQLSTMEKVLFVEIHSLDNERGCYASNAYFAEFFQVSIRQIIRYLSSLKTHGFRRIVLIGDSGGNQDGMKTVAAALSAKWKDSPCRIAFAKAFANGHSDQR